MLKYNWLVFNEAVLTFVETVRAYYKTPELILPYFREDFKSGKRAIQYSMKGN